MSMDDVITTLSWLAFGTAVPLATFLVFLWRRELHESKWWTGIVVEGRRIQVGVDQELCMGASSCVELAPEVFRLDWSKRKSMFDPAPLEKISDTLEDQDRIFRAAQSCPYRAIYLEDAEHGERIFP